MTTKASGLDVLTVNAVIAAFPPTVAVFERHGIDSCCGGVLPVAEAARRHGLDPESLREELLAAMEESTDG